MKDLIPLFIFLAIQTGVLVWWAATITARLGFVVQQVRDAVESIKTLASCKDVERVHHRIDQLEQRVNEQMADYQKRLTRSPQL